MRLPDGKEMWGKFVYRDVAAPERITFVNSFADENGNPVPNPYLANWPLEVLTIVAFYEHQGKTMVTIRTAPIQATDLERKTFDEGRESMGKGFAGTFSKLDDYLAKS